MKDWTGLLKKIAFFAKQVYESIMDFCKHPLGFGTIFIFLASLIFALILSGYRRFSIDYIGENLSSLWFNLSIDYVVPFIAFGATILALALPLSYGTLKDISDKYGSYPVRQKFARHWAVRFMPVLLLLVIGWGIAMVTFSGESLSLPTKVFLVGYLVLFLVLCSAVLSLFKLTRLHSLGSKTLLEQYLDESVAILEKAKSNELTEISLKKEFQENMIGIGDVLAWEAGNTFDPDAVVDGQKGYLDILSLLFKIYDENPQKFNFLISKQKPEKDSLRVDNQINRFLGGEWDDDSMPSIILSQIGRVFNASLNFPQEAYRKKPLTLKTISILSKFLIGEASRTNRDILLNAVFQRLHQMGRESLDAKRGYLGVISLIQPNIDLIFPRPLQQNNYPDRSYLSLYFRCLRDNVFLFVNKSEKEDIESLFRFLFGYGHIGVAANSRNISPLGDLRFNLQNPLGELANELEILQGRVKWLVTERELESWENRLESVWEKTELQNKGHEGQMIKRQSLDTAYDCMMFNKLLLLMMEFGAYCLFKEKFDYIQELWEYKQPPDATSTWCGHDLVPSSADEILGLFWRFSDDVDRHDFPIEGHHGLSQYFHSYIILLLARSLGDKMPGKGSSGDSISLSLKCFHPSELSSAQLYVEKLMKVSQKLLEEKELLDTLGFPEKNRKFLFERKIPKEIEKFSKRCKKQIETRIAKGEVNKDKVDDFVNEFLTAFENHAVLRSIYKKQGAFQDLSNQKETTGEEAFGLFQLDDKEIFLQESTTDYSGTPIWYAEELANGEDAQLLSSLKKNSKTLNFSETAFPLESVIKTLDRFGDLSNVYVFVSFDWMQHLQEPGFYQHCSLNSPEKQEHVNGFLLFRDNKIPCILFRTTKRLVRDTCLVVDMKRAGELVALNPVTIDWEEGTNSPGTKDGFFFDIRALSDLTQIKKEMLENPPEWLIGMGDSQAQEAFLNTKVRLIIQERFDLRVKAKDKPQPGIYSLSLSSFSKEKSENG